MLVTAWRSGGRLCFHGPMDESMQRRTILRRAAAGLLLAAALLLAACSAQAPSTAEGAIGSAEMGDLPTPAELSAAFEETLNGSGVPGGAVIVTDADDAEALALFGEAAAGTPTSADTRFAYRSVTKSFVGTVILQLADEGRLALDAPVSDYVSDVPGGAGITIAELGAMRSGLANYSALPGLGELLSTDPGREPEAAELLVLAFAEPPVFAPGSAYEYSNTNTLLLGEVIESVTGDAWTAAVEQRILRPLGLESVSYGFTGSPLDSAGFQLSGGEAVEELPVVAPGWFGAAGGLMGDVSDLAAWGRALGSGSLLEKATQEERLAMLGPVDDDPASPFYDRYGFAMGEIDGWIGHTGNGLGFQALTMHHPASGRTIAILLNGTGEDPDLPAKVFKRLREL